MKRRSNLTAAVPAFRKLLCATVIGALGVLAAPAQAALVTFDAAANVVTPVLNAGDTAYNTGDAFTEGLFTMQVNNNPTADPSDYGLVGAMIDSTSSFACTITGCPESSGSVYFGGLNDGWLNIVINGAAGFRVDGLRFAFISPTADTPDGMYGRLVLTGTTTDGALISTSGDFAGQNGDGKFAFSSLAVDYAFRNTTLTNLTVNACLFDGMGGCVSAHELVQNQAQFAIDDLDLAVIPEPASIALMMLGLLGLGAVSRRRA